MILALLTYGLAKTYLGEQREHSAIRQARANARLVENVLASSEADVPTLLGALETAGGSRALVHSDGRWFSTSDATDPGQLPSSLRKLVLDDASSGHQRANTVAGGVLAVGFPLDGGGYFEIFPLLELKSTLRTLRLALTAAAAVTAIGAAVVGWWASGRVVEPLTTVAQAAAAITKGELGTRLDEAGYSELRSLSSSFNDMVESLQRRIQRDARFASSVAHELRSPLTTLRTATEVLAARRGALDPRTARALDLMVSEQQRFDRLVLDLLEISRANAGAADDSAEEVVLADLVRHAVAGTAPEVPVVVVEPALSLRVCVDKRRLERVLTNLLENADSHGGGAVRVEVGKEGLGTAYFAVEDEGPGVSMDQRELIFEPFVRGAAAGSRGSSEGVGLGLALVAEHVALHGGRVRVEEARAGGARFVVELPAVTT